MEEYTPVWDREREITEVTRCSDGYQIMRGYTASYLSDKYNSNHIEPKVGDLCSVACIHYSEIVGFKINGEVIYLLTGEEVEARHKKELEEIHNKDKKEFEERLAKWDDLIKEVHPIHLKEITELHQKALDGDQEAISMEGYILFIMQEGNKFSKHLKTAQEVASFKAASFEDEKQMIPEMSDDHTGNTFNLACRACLQIIEHNKEQHC